MKAGTTPNRKRFHVRSLRNFFGGSVAFARAAPPNGRPAGARGHTRDSSVVYTSVPFCLHQVAGFSPAPDDRGAGLRPVNELC